MSDRFLTDLADVIRAAGLTVEEVSGWKTRGATYNGRKRGLDAVSGVMLHHTAGPATGDYPSYNTVLNGRPDVPGPLAQLGLARSGKVIVFAAGLAWHPGKGSGFGWKTDAASWQTIGIEAESTGKGDWTPAQLDAYPRLVAALCRAYKIPVNKVVGHKEWAPGRKIDPAGLPGDMEGFRAQVAKLLASASQTPSKPSQGASTSNTDTRSSKMYNPAVGRVTSEFSPRRWHPIKKKYEAHLGIDIANSAGTPIRAAFAGTVEKVGTNVVSGRTGIGVLIRNPDGERQYYGHLRKASVKVGQKVSIGQLIGEMGATGNATGPHLHFEVWGKNGSPRNPRVDFAHFGITPGKDKTAPPAPVAPPKKPAKTPVSPSKPAVNNGLTASVKSALKKMGLKQTVQGIKDYQKAMGLYVDGVWGTKTQAFYKDTVNLQTALNRFKSNLPKLVVDGYLGAKTKAKIKEIRSRNGFGAQPYTNAQFRAFLTKHTGIKL